MPICAGLPRPNYTSFSLPLQPSCPGPASHPHSSPPPSHFLPFVTSLSYSLPPYAMTLLPSSPFHFPIFPPSYFLSLTLLFPYPHFSPRYPSPLLLFTHSPFFPTDFLLLSCIHLPLLMLSPASTQRNPEQSLNVGPLDCRHGRRLTFLWNGGPRQGGGGCCFGWRSFQSLCLYVPGAYPSLLCFSLLAFSLSCKHQLKTPGGCALQGMPRHSACVSGFLRWRRPGSDEHTPTFLIRHDVRHSVPVHMQFRSGCKWGAIALLQPFVNGEHLDPLPGWRKSEARPTRIKCSWRAVQAKIWPIVLHVPIKIDLLSKKRMCIRGMPICWLWVVFSASCRTHARRRPLKSERKPQ